MGPRFNRNAKSKCKKNRAMNFKARKIREHKNKVLIARDHVFNLTPDRLSDEEYLLLAKGLKFVPSSISHQVKQQVMRDFNEFARKLKCKYMFHDPDSDNNIHPFRMKSGFEPEIMNNSVQTYIDNTRLELSSMEVRKSTDNLSISERQARRRLKGRKDIIIKKADKNNMCVVIKKTDYILKGERQLNSKYFCKITNPNLNHLENIITQKLSEMNTKGVLDNIIYDFLRKAKDTRIGRLYLLPKIHKLNIETFNEIKNNGSWNSPIIPPGRPIISQIGSPTERISQYVDYFLAPVVQTLSTYIRDSSDFILKVEQLRPHAKCLRVSYDVTSLYTNMHFEELITAVQMAYTNFNKAECIIPAPPTTDLCFLLRLVLENNIFEFNSALYKQTIGCAMGSKCSPSVCDIRLHQITDEIIDKFTGKNKIIYHGRYRDDGFIIFHGLETYIHELFEIANSQHPLLKFTYEISTQEINFLDTTVFKGKRYKTSQILDFKTYIKPTNTFQYLERNSAHNSSVFKGFSKGETIRHMRNTSNKITLLKILPEFEVNLLKRGYDKIEIKSNMQNVLANYSREKTLQSKSSIRKRGIPLVFVTKYNPCIRHSKRKLIKYWHILAKDEDCQKVFSELSIGSYKRKKNLGYILTSSTFK
ncbi:uncharacterized protein LOC133179540 [Saccostrea echinata]|uniref:uncharacterized protein LOC133179540 n=1 Tax=Saccostrea echinata TaxID=191078 RepID=UPI002A8241C4|nr:uncharacterized protein LOC133179540 [Saccostrea echinata]